MTTFLVPFCADQISEIDRAHNSLPDAGILNLLQLKTDSRKKEEKRVRADKEHVQEMLFSAFEKHQYYNLKDLERITKQPVVSF